LEVFLNNFKKRFFVSLFSIPIIFSLLNFRFFSNILIFLVYSLSIFEWFKLFKKKSFVFYIGLFILLLLFYSALNFYNNNINSIYFLWVLTCVWLNDIGGYVFGKLFGKHKLIRVSPKKTWEGVFGSLFLSQFAFVVLLLQKNFELSLKIFFLQFFFSIISQFGDLLMSYCKRINNIKDSSKFLPGHGGFLDRIDGLLWVLIFANML